MKEKRIAIAFIEFDLDEGPQFSYLFPRVFPIDYQQEFQISNYALYSEGFFQLETENLYVFGYTFKKKIQHERTRYTKVAIAFLIKKNTCKIDLKVILNFIENEIIPLSQEIAKGSIYINDALMKEILKNFDTYLQGKNTQKNKISKDVEIDDKRKQMASKKIKEERLVIVDAITNYLYLLEPLNYENYERKFSLEETISKTNFFSLTPLLRFLIFSSSEKLLRKALKILSLTEKRYSMITLDTLKKIIED